MVQLITNIPQYENDIAEEVRMFLGMVAIGPEAETPEYRIEIRLDGERRTVVGTVLPHGAKATCTVEACNADELECKRVEKRAVKRVAYALMQQVCPTVMPWGSLTGIRPTKLLRELCGRYGDEEAVRRFREEFSVRDDKLRLAATINAVQKPFVESVRPNDLDVYVGIPYCRSRCLYCSFGAEVARTAEAVEAYLAPLFEDIRNGGRLVNEGGWNVRAMYIGGGTPTVLNAEQLDRLLTLLKAEYGGFGNEFTVEAGRPDTITVEKLHVLRSHGVQRISINPQTMSDETLQRIGRFHSAEQIEQAFRMAREIGFSSINMDLIAGLPGETEADMERTLQSVCALRPDNLTVHTLAIKRSSRLKEQLERFPMPPKEAVERMIDMGFAAAKSMGMWPYYMYRQKYQNGNLENVGYSTDATVCMYNIDMMEETTSILAHGAGAMTKRVFGRQNRVERIANPKDVPTYAQKLPVLDAAKRELFLGENAPEPSENS